MGFLSESRIDFKVPGRFKISEINKQEIERIFGVEEHWSHAIVIFQGKTSY